MTIDDVATGLGGRKLSIRGRPKQGTREEYILLEEPEDPVLMHYGKQLPGGSMPHFKTKCQYCEIAEAPKPLWYIGGFQLASKELVIVELTEPCFRSAESFAAIRMDGETGPLFRGLRVTISRQDFDRSPRVLRSNEHSPRADVSRMEWGLCTRYELAKIWRIPVKLQIWREQA